MSPPLSHFLCGGNGGSPFALVGTENGAMLKKLWVWVGGWQVKCVRAWLTNGESAQFGNPAGKYSEFEFQPGELFTSLSLWGNGAGTRLGAIKFRTNKNREFFPQMTDWGLKTEYPVDVGSGICLGIEGKGGSDIDCMGFVFINSVKHSELINVTYPTLHRELPNIQMEEMKSVTYKNSASKEQSYKIETSKTVEKSSSWSITNGIEACVSLSVSAGIPEVVNFEVSTSLTVSSESTHGLTNTESKTELLAFDVTVPPGKTVSIEVKIGRMEVDLPYKGTVHMELMNGSTFDIPMEGQFMGVSYTKAIVETTET